MPKRNENMSKYLARLVPGIAKMSEDELLMMNLDPSAVKEAAAGMRMEDGATPGPGQAGGYPNDQGKSPQHGDPGWSVVAQKGIKRAYSLLAPLDGVSTTFSKSFEVMGNPDVLPKMKVPLYDKTGEAHVNDFTNMDNRRSQRVKFTEVTLAKVDEVVELYAGDIAAGIDPAPLVELALESVAEKTHKLFMQACAVGQPQGDDDSKTIAAKTIPAIDAGWGYRYAQRKLTEAVQPSVDGLLLSPEYYGELKGDDKNAYNPQDLDAGLVKKVQDTDQLGTGAVGVIMNKRAIAAGLKAPYFIKGAYATWQQLKYENSASPFVLVSYFVPGLNCIKIAVATLVGFKVTDASAIMPLVPASPAETGEGDAA